jgi:micrococcal nuclease
MFRYNATVLRVIDGDTIDAMIDLGFSTWKKIRIRFYGINTPESRTRDLEEKKRGLAAKDRVVEALEANDGKFVLQSHGVGKFGRCLGEIFINDDEISLQQMLINEGHGVPYFGGKRK